MRHLLAGVAAPLVLALMAASLQAQQQSVIQISSSTQIVTGDPARLGGQQPVSPDLTVLWARPGIRFGTWEVEFGATRRGDRAVPTRTAVSVRDLNAFGLSWTIQAGDTYLSPALSTYRFSNLFAPAVTFRGGRVFAASKATTVSVTAGRATALRNIFGSDPDPLDQTLGLARVSHWLTPRLEISGRAARGGTPPPAEFAWFVADSDSAGAGLTARVTPDLQLVADAGYAKYRWRESDSFDRDGSGLVGALWTHARGWLQVNAQRFSPGEFPVLNYQFRDQEGVFAASEFDLGGRVRLFGGANATRTNLTPDAAQGSGYTVPRTTTERAFGGARVRLSNRSFVTVRYEGGDRTSATVTQGLRSATDTGVASFEWRGTFAAWNVFGRYQRREQVESVATTGSFTQQEGFVQVFVNPTRRSQLFGAANWISRLEPEGGGQDYWLFSAGAQYQVPHRDLWLRAEATSSGSLDLLTDEFRPGQTLNVGVSGLVAPRTTLAFDLFVDRSPSIPTESASPYMTRSMIRIVHTIPAGSVRVPTTTIGSAGAPRRERGTGTVAGDVFVDWNDNGARDPGEETIDGITLVLDDVARVQTGGEGRFEFAQAPVGLVTVGLDVAALPVDYDIPLVSRVDIDVARNETSRVSFGLVPFGTIDGRVLRDVNRNGAADESDESIDDAVVVLDGGLRSELVRGGAFRFDAVHSGPRQVRLLAESLPAGAQILGRPEATLTIARGQLEHEVTFLIDVEPRAEIRRVFPAAGAPPARPAPATPSRPAAPLPAPPPVRPAPAAPTAPATAPTSAAAPFDVQVAAMSRLDRAQAIVGTLRSRGYDAWIVQPRADRPGDFYRVRAGTFPDARTASRAVDALSAALGVRPVLAGGAEATPFRIQAAALADETRARAIVERLAGLGYDAYLLPPMPEGADTLYRVRIGTFATRAQAEPTAAALERALGADVWITQDHPPFAAGLAPARTPRRRAGGFALQVGALADEQSAGLLVARARAAGYDAYIVAPEPGASPALYRVRIGGYASRNAAAADAAAVERALGTQPWVTEESGGRERAGVTAPAGPFLVQAGAFATPERARALVERLRALGQAPYLRPPEPGDRNSLYRVGVGPFPTLSEAEAAARALEAALGTRVWITRDGA